MLIWGIAFSHNLASIGYSCTLTVLASDTCELTQAHKEQTHTYHNLKGQSQVYDQEVVVVIEEYRISWSVAITAIIAFSDVSQDNGHNIIGYNTNMYVPDQMHMVMMNS